MKIGSRLFIEINYFTFIVLILDTSTTCRGKWVVSDVWMATWDTLLWQCGRIKAFQLGIFKAYHLS